MRAIKRLLSALLLLAVLLGAGAGREKALDRDIALHAATVRSVVDGVIPGAAYSWLASFTDGFGSRIAGSAQLSEAVDFLVAEAHAAGLENVHTEETDPLPTWVRGAESATLTSPRLAGEREAKLHISALGRSVGTPAGGLEAPVVVVGNWSELDAVDARGSIVLLNAHYVGYGETVQYRVHGAARAAQRGAVAVLVRSITPFSPNLPHTGLGSSDGPTPIPAAAVSLEDADMLARMAARGQDVRVRLSLGCHEGPPASGRVVVAEIAGAEAAHEVVLLSGHLDSWDVGSGAVDDGGGLALGLHSMLLVKRLGMRPRRTLRFVAWSGEEYGMGSSRYWREHAEEAGNITIAFESDAGVFEPLGLQLSAPVQAHAVARAVGRLLVEAGSNGAVESGGEGTDIAPAMALGIPGASLANEATAYMRNGGRNPSDPRLQGDYFVYHHTEADTVSALDAGQVDAALRTWAAFALVFANMSAPLPRGPPADDAALMAALGSAHTRPPPQVCSARWSDDLHPPQGGAADLQGGVSVLHLAFACFASSILGAAGCWLLLNPGNRAPGGSGSDDQRVAHETWASRPVPVVPIRREGEEGCLEEAHGGTLEAVREAEEGAEREALLHGQASALR